MWRRRIQTQLKCPEMRAASVNAAQQAVDQLHCFDVAPFVLLVC